MRYRFTAAAEADLTKIWDRIALDSEASADRYLRRIKDECEALAKSPLAGAIRFHEERCSVLAGRSASFALHYL
jgi:plasmid stabilization system protein ParE